MGIAEILQLVVQGGSIVLLALVLIGIFYLAIRFGPQMLNAWNGYTKAIVGLTAEISGMRADINATKQRMSGVAEDVAALSATSTGQFPAVKEPRKKS